MHRAIDFGPPGTRYVWQKKNLGYVVQADGSVLQTDARFGAASGGRPRFAYFSSEAFVKRICRGDACLLCGCAPDEAEFNNEHVLPRWLLKRHSLFEKTIRFGDAASMKYGRYTLPCCAECNGLLGADVEQRVKAFTQSYQGTDEIGDETVSLLFRWLCLIFVKVHLKDKIVPVSKDPRQNTGIIASQFPWEHLHHIHCVARTFHTGAVIREGVLGSLFITRVRLAAGDENFDYCDLSAGRALMIRLGTLGMIAVLDDAGLSNRVMRERVLPKMHDDPSPIQLRELLAHFANSNLRALSRPTFASSLSPEGAYQITATPPPKLEYADLDRPVFNYLFMHCCGHAVRSHPEKERFLATLEKGTVSFLFDDDGNFIPD